MLGDFPLKDKIVVVTGGGSGTDWIYVFISKELLLIIYIKYAGIGFSFAELAVALDAKVIIGDLKLTPDAEKLVQDNSAVTFVKCDVTKWKDLQNLIDISEKELGDVPDVYIPCAGVFEPVGIHSRYL